MSRAAAIACAQPISTAASSSSICGDASPSRAPARSRNAPARCAAISTTRWHRASRRSVSPRACSTIRSGPPFLVAERIEDPALLTILIYGHGDTVRGLDDLWRPGLSPWVLAVEGDRVYGRGTADNKGQHSINIAALAAVLAERERAGARLGFNVKILIEMGEEVGSIGLHELCVRHKDGLLKADVLIASDGPRIAPGQPTIFLGARGGHPIDLVVESARGRASFRQLGRPARQSRHHPGARARLHHRCARNDPRAGMAAAAAAVGAAQS